MVMPAWYRHFFHGLASFIINLLNFFPELLFFDIRQDLEKIMILSTAPSIEAHKIALKGMAEEVDGLNANAVVGINPGYRLIRAGILMVAASGRTVKFR